jgi:A/G-specific adenine glycosylase
MMDERQFQNKVMEWWSENARDLPWRNDPTPYNVLVSEVMLQQTQVNRVVPKYHEFLREFPTIEALAKADTKHLIQVWSGLGYNRRALWLREAAREIVERGDFPQTDKELRALKGIGPYTSKSILIFAFNSDLAAVDTNIRRVLVASGFATEHMTPKQLQDVADGLLLPGRSRDWHNALMDYGSAVLTSNVTGITPTSRQPCYAGSTRQLRGVIIKNLSQRASVSIEMLHRNLCDEDQSLDYLQEILDGLINDGLVGRTERGEYRIAD